MPLYFQFTFHFLVKMSSAVAFRTVIIRRYRNFNISKSALKISMIY